MTEISEGTAAPGVPVYDVVIVGAGPVGAAVAIRAIAANKSVLMLDAGIGDAMQWDQYSAYVDTFRTSTMKATSTGYPANTAAPWPNVLQISNAPSNGLNPPVYRIPPGAPMDSGYYVEAGPLPFRSDFIKMVGGTTLHWQGSSFRMLPNDFRMQSEYGQATDWPISYDDLEPYYEDAENQIGVAADVSDQSYAGIWFRSGYVYPMQRMPASCVDQFLVGAIGDDLQVTIDGASYTARGIPLPSGRNTEPNLTYNYRRDPQTAIGYSPISAVGNRDAGLRCQGNSSCMPVCPVQAKYSAMKSINALRRSTTGYPQPGAMTLQHQTVATSFIVSPDTNKIVGVGVKRYTSPNDKTFTPDTVYGTVIVLAGNAIENTKLMLNAGVAKGNSNLGANLMDHPYLYVSGQAPEAVYPFRGPDTTLGIDSLRDGPYRAKHASFRASVSNWGWSGSPGRDLATLIQNKVYGTQLRDQLGDALTTQMKFGIMLEQLPSPSNSVSVSPKWLDDFGDPRPVLNYDYDDYVMEGVSAAVNVVDQIFKAANITNTTNWTTPALANSPGNSYVEYEGIWYAIMGAGHIVGTHRMGHSADDGVTDSNGLVFGYPNLYAVGCGSMVTIGTSNPTLTAVALAHKTGDAIVAALK